jgi:hypothetical protein
LHVVWGVSAGQVGHTRGKKEKIGARAEIRFALGED